MYNHGERRPMGDENGRRSPAASPGVHGMVPKSIKPVKSQEGISAEKEGPPGATKFERELHSALEQLHNRHETRKLTAIMSSNQV